MWQRPSSPGNSRHSALPSLLLLHPCGRYLSPFASYSLTLFKGVTNVHCDCGMDCFVVGKAQRLKRQGTQFWSLLNSSYDNYSKILHKSFSIKMMMW